MKILHVVPYYWPAVRYGGPVFSVAGLCRALVARGHETHVYTTAVDGPDNSNVVMEAEVDIDGVQVTYFPSTRLRRLFWSPAMKKALQHNIDSFDIVHLHTVYVWPVYAAAMAAQKAGIPYILAPRGMLEKALIRKKSCLIKMLWIHFCGKKILSGAGAVQVTTNREKDEIAAFKFKMPEMVLVPNGIDIPDIPQNNLVKEHEWADKSYVLFLSRVNWKKGLDRLIDAWGYNIDIPLVIAGNDEENYIPELKAIARERGVLDNIYFIGSVSGLEKWALYQGAEMLVLPSYSENFGNVVLEAMAVGCPVAVTPEVGLSEAVKMYGVGAVIEGEPQKLACGIKNLLADKDALAQMGRRGMETARKHFSWSSIGRQMETVYMELVQDAH